MANFCKKCTLELFGDLQPDIVADPGEIVWDLCEGCGWGWFDDKGIRVETHQDETDGNRDSG